MLVASVVDTVIVPLINTLIAQVPVVGEITEWALSMQPSCRRLVANHTAPFTERYVGYFPKKDSSCFEGKPPRMAAPSRGWNVDLHDNFFVLTKPVDGEGVAKWGQSGFWGKPQPQSDLKLVPS